VLRAIPADLLIRFEEIGLELHHLDELDKSDVQRCRTDIIGETGGAFHAGHVHANNFCSVAIVGGFPAPETLELTSKRSGGAGALHTVCPTPIDMPNYPQWPDYLLWYFPFCRAPARCVFLADRDTLPPGDPRGMFCCFRWFPCISDSEARNFNRLVLIFLAVARTARLGWHSLLKAKNFPVLREFALAQERPCGVARIALRVAPGE
jgi:hypothetical protein